MNQAWTKYLPASLRAKVEGRAYLQNVVANTGWQFADSIVRMGIGLVVGIWIARYLGPEQFGLLNFAIAFVALFSPLVSLGLEEVVVRNLVRDPAAKDETLGTSLVLKLAGGVVSFVATTGAIFLLRPADGLSHWLVVIIAAGSIFYAFNVIECWFNSQVQAKYLVIAKNGTFLIAAAVKVLLVVTGQPLIAFAWVAAFEVAAGSVGLVIVYISRQNRLRNWRLDFEKAGSLLRDSWPLLFSGIVVMVYMRIDQVMLGQILGSKEVGIYSVAVRLAEIWMFIPQIIFWSVFPAVVEARMSDETLLYERLQKLYNLMALTAYSVAIPVTLLSNSLVVILFGEAYARAGFMLSVLVWANLFSSFEIARSAFLTSMNWTRIQLVTLILGGVLNIGLNYLLIPLYGGVGAAIASLISYWFACHGTCFLFKPLFRTGIMLSKAIIYPKVW